MANTQIYRTGKDRNLLPADQLDDLVILRLDVDAGRPPAGRDEARWPCRKNPRSNSLRRVTCVIGRAFARMPSLGRSLV